MRVLLRDLWFHKGTWIGFCIVVLSAAVGITFIMAASQSYAEYVAGTQYQLKKDLLSVPAIFIFFTAIVIVSMATTQVVSQLRRSMAMFVLTGYGPWKMASTMLIETLFFSLCASVLGALAAIPLFPHVYQTYIKAALVQDVPLGHVGTSAIVTAIVWMVVLTCVASVPSLLRVARIAPMEALQEKENQKKRIGLIRILIAIVSLGLAGVIFMWPLLTPVHSERALDDQMNQIMMASFALTLLLIAFVVCVGPVLYSPLISLWTLIIPGQICLPWFLARKASVRRTTQSATAISSVFFPITFTSGIATATFTTAATLGGGDINAQSMAATIGPPLILCVIGAATSVLMSSKERDKDVALLTATGISTGQNIGASIMEAIIYSITAAIPAVIINGVIGWYAYDHWLQARQVPLLTFGWILGIIAVVVSIALIAAATLLPTVKALSKSPIYALAQDG